VPDFVRPWDKIRARRARSPANVEISSTNEPLPGINRGDNQFGKTLVSLPSRFKRHGFSGVLNLVPVNIRYYSPQSIKRCFTHTVGKWMPGVYEWCWRQGHPDERIAIESFMRSAAGPTERLERRAITKAIAEVHRWVDCGHLQAEMLEVIEQILDVPKSSEGVVVEAGTFRGGSAAKFSWACAYRARSLVVFDSFQGLPESGELHDRSIFGDVARFKGGDYKGSLDAVKQNISKYGRIETCEFVEGWFEDTMPAFQRPIAVGYVDVDLASSTRTCMKFLYPLLVPGGVIFSQDGHLPLVLAVLDDDKFWLDEVGVKRPRMVGLGSRKLVQIWKD
jgi:O-methyltransferase